MRMHDMFQFTSDTPVAVGQNNAGWRVVVAEDVPEHAQVLMDMIRRLRPNWSVAPLVSDVQDLLQSIEDVVPNLVMLDVHLAGGRSIDLVEQFPYPVPVVFTTGDPTFATIAYDCEAIDYLLKPVRAARLERALGRAEAFAKSPSRTNPEQATREPGWMMAHRGAGQLVVHLKDILYLQARGKMTLVVTADGESFVKRGLGVVEMHLDANRFKRVHRSTIINIDHASKVVRDELGRMRVTVKRRDEWLDVSQPFEHLFRPT